MQDIDLYPAIKTRRPRPTRRRPANPNHAVRPGVWGWLLAKVLA